MGWIMDNLDQSKTISFYFYFFLYFKQYFFEEIFIKKNQIKF
jgi:hypothetical protein